MKGANIFYIVFTVLGLFIPGCVLFNMLEEHKDGKVVGSAGYIYAAVTAIVGGLYVGFLPKIAEASLEKPSWAVVAGIILVSVIATFWWLCYAWKKEGSRPIELVCAIVFIITLTFIGKQAGSAATTAMTSAFWKSVIMWLPTAASIVTVGYVVSNFLFFQEERKKKKGWKVAGIIAMIIAAVLLLLSLFSIKFGQPDFSKLAEDDGEEIVNPDDGDGEDLITTGDEEPLPETELHYAFWNPSLQYDEDPENDFNFGYNPYLYETVETKDAKWFDNDFRTRVIAVDPATFAADAAYLDYICGTRYMGEFYDSAKQDWSLAINNAKEAWMADEMLNYASLDAFNAFLDSAISVDVVEGESEDQMFQNPYTVNGVPDVIVMQSKQKGHFLVYTFKIKGVIKKVAYRIECGYQPANVAKGMKINPVPPPTKKVDPTPDPGKGGTPEPTPTPNPKDKTKGTKVTPQDDKGPGPDTNNGKGAQESKAEEHPNSTDVKDYKEYKDQMKELEDINKSQKTDKDPSTPSTPTKPNTNIDANADKLPAADAKTPKTAETQKGEKISNNKDNPAGTWGGPTD